MPNSAADRRTHLAPRRWALLGSGVAVTTFEVEHPEVLRLANREQAAEDTTIVKGCRSEHALETSPLLRMATPASFREDGGSLIWDAEECVVKEPERVERRQDDPDDLRAFAQAQAQTESEKPSGRMFGAAPVTQLNVTETTTSTYEMGDNCLLWCAAQMPQNRIRWSDLKNALDPDYDHFTTIRDPHAFASALALEASEHQRKLESSVVFSNPFNGAEVRCRNIAVVYGPVAYVGDRHAHIRDSESAEEFIVRSPFTKSTTYRDQLEYRFAVLSHHRLDDDELFLPVSKAMRDALDDAPDPPAGGLPMGGNDVSMLDLPLKVRDCFAGLPPQASGAALGALDVRTDLRLEVNIAGTRHTSMIRHNEAVHDLTDADSEALDRAIAEEPRSSSDARIAQIAIDGGPDNVIRIYDLDGVRSSISVRTEAGNASVKLGKSRAFGRREVHADTTEFDGKFALGHDAGQIILTVVTMNPDATVVIGQPCPNPDLPQNHVNLCDDSDTEITVTAKSPDGAVSSHLNIVIDAALSHRNRQRTT